MNGTADGRGAPPGIPESPVFSDIDGEDSLDEHGGDYTTRLEELMSDDEELQEDTATVGGEDEENEDEAFFYNGADSQPIGTYREQLRDVLGPDDEDDELEEREVGHSLVRAVEEKERYEAAMDDEARVRVFAR